MIPRHRRIYWLSIQANKTNLILDLEHSAIFLSVIRINNSSAVIEARKEETNYCL
jgi:hypothetical protein